MFDALRGADQGEIGGKVILLLRFGDHLFAFFNNAHHAFAWLGSRGSAEYRQAPVETRNLLLVFLQMLLEEPLQLGRASGFSPSSAGPLPVAFQREGYPVAGGPQFLNRLILGEIGTFGVYGNATA